VRYPFTGETIGEARLRGRAKVESALDLAGGVRLGLDRHARAQVLKTVAERIRTESEEVARLITWESGLCLRDTRHETRRAVDVFHFAALETLRDDGAVFACHTSP